MSADVFQNHKRKLDSFETGGQHARYVTTCEDSGAFLAFPLFPRWLLWVHECLSHVYNMYNSPCLDELGAIALLKKVIEDHWAREAMLQCRCEGVCLVLVPKTVSVVSIRGGYQMRYLEGCLRTPCFFLPCSPASISTAGCGLGCKRRQGSREGAKHLLKAEVCEQVVGLSKLLQF